MKNIKLTSLLLILAITLTALFGCSKITETTAVNTTAAATEVKTEATTEAETTDLETLNEETAAESSDETTEETVTAEYAYVSIYTGSEYAIFRAEVALEDKDGDVDITINDALISAHSNNGNADGYSAVTSDFGLSIAKLWGVENGGSYGIVLNHSFSNGLSDKISAYDDIMAYVYTDTTTFSDTVTFFDVAEISDKPGETLTLTMYKLGFDENWATVVLPVGNATITFNGETMDMATDAEGVVNIVLPEGETTISAVLSDGTIIVPPLCVYTPIAE